MVCIVSVVRLPGAVACSNGMTTGGLDGLGGRGRLGMQRKKLCWSGSRQLWIQLHSNLKQCKMGQEQAKCVQGNGPSSRVVQGLAG